MSVRAALVSWVLDLFKRFGLVETSSLQAPAHTLISPFATPLESYPYAPLDSSFSLHRTRVEIP